MTIKFLFAKLFKKLRGSAIKNSIIHPTSKVESGCNLSNTKMDRYSFCGYDCEIYDAEIGAFCSIANNVIIGGGMHPMNWVSMSPVFYEGRDSVKTKFASHKRDLIKQTIIGNDVWIGQYVLIKQGVRIGDGAVIGMGSVVTKDVEPYSIVAGSPAREINKRFDDPTINKLLESKWWEFPDNRLHELGRYFNSPQVFLNKVTK